MLHLHNILSQDSLLESCICLSVYYSTNTEKRRRKTAYYLLAMWHRFRYLRVAKVRVVRFAVGIVKNCCRICVCKKNCKDVVV